MVKRSWHVFACMAVVGAFGCGSTNPVVSEAVPVVEPVRDGDTSTETVAPRHPAEHEPRDRDDEARVSPAEAPGAAEGSRIVAIERFRPPDLRPRHNVDRVAEQGLRLFESERLRLFTDVDPAEAEGLPPLIDALFKEWESYFGELPPARDGSAFQLTGYLMRDQRTFREAGLLPANLPVFAHGKHQGQEFWLNDQDHPYYRRHLLLHEATHCYMQAMGGTTGDVPLWYLEGMAELFATHRVNDDGTPTFRVVPDDPAAFVGFGRIEMIAHDIRAGHAFTLPQLASLTPEGFQQRQSAYGWSWATCLLADRNPTYADAFREVGRRYPLEGFGPIRQLLFDPLTADFAVEWTLLTRNFEYGHDIAASAITFAPGTSLDVTHPQTIDIAADRGWQSSGVAVSPEETYTITAAGRVTLANEPRPWISEPQGVTLRYAHGQPIGRLLGLVIGDTPEDLSQPRYVGDVVSIGRSASFSPLQPGTLYLRVNDFDSELADNAGQYDVGINVTAPEDEPQ